ncbi:DNA cytosine methyltransferase [Profundibacter amoris]|uniref:Cytosine-specific methyltransferase n=1 Tax=Profundibacter amoris TaxID=2171755 RepID=A0A347UIH3_9RHOB|nr:DNA cytosine methyltransferase [Profundibacter amoris]
MNELALSSRSCDAFFGLSLCAGAGGIDLGLTIACPGYRTVCYVERESYAAATLVARMEDKALDKAPVWDDVGTFDGRPWRGTVDFISGGYPCQPFSVAGKRKGVNDPRHLWPHFARIIGECQPEWVFLENVANHLNLGYREVRCELENLGYRVTEGLFTAAEVGAPHKRQRLFILARRNQLADTEGQRQREPADETDAIATGRKTRDESRDQSGDVAHTPDRQFPDTGRSTQKRKGAGPHGAGLANADGERRLQAERRQSPHCRPDPCGGDVADPAGAGLERNEQPGACETATTSAQSHGSTGEFCRVFPPGPDDLAGWRDYLRSAPQLEPGLCRGADGLAHRVNRLRLCGNGVVPLVAAHAFRILAARFKDDG